MHRNGTCIFIELFLKTNMLIYRKQLRRFFSFTLNKTKRPFG